ncbi:MAG: phosphomethylpyrimidine synthase ThiC [Gemmatimonadota bacterium]|nr:MAG: phosphomethylpyrimidine synthase ThiC [Gemmatimonadota bacterium]
MEREKNLIDGAREGVITESIEDVAVDEGVSPKEVASGVASGTIVITKNRNHANIRPLGIGEGLRTKINANIGTSPDQVSLDLELKKLAAAIGAGADTVMDLSTGGDIVEVLRAVLEHSTVPVGTVPIYEAVCKTVRKGKRVGEMRIDELFEVIERQCADGVDFVTVHCGVTKRAVETLKQQGRLTDIVSRGGAFLAVWMSHNNRENPLYEFYERLLDIARRYEVTLSLGDGLRPGSLADATDRPQLEELIVIGELVDRAREAGVQAMVEGPGHVPLNQVEANVLLEKRLCKGAPFYVLGPLVTDVTPGYDHISGAIGGALAAYAGADFLCYVTPSEHLRLPTVEDVHQGVIASRIAAHAGDVAKGLPGARDWDDRMSQARKALDWKRMFELSIDPEKSKRYRSESDPQDNELCTMCGEYCAMRRVEEALR